MAKLRPLQVGGVPGCANIPGGEDCQCWPEWTADNGYFFGDVVQQGGVLYYATRDVPPGTPFLAADWAPYRPAATAIPPHNENSTYFQYQPVAYNDKLYTARTDLPPGPFDPANWQEISVEGLVEVVDSATIDFTGTGAAGDPVSADVKLDPDPDNLLSATANGLILTADNIPFPDPSQILISEEVTLRVDYVTGDDATADGTLAKPFATVSAAIGVATTGDRVEIYPGTYIGNFAPKSDVTVVGLEGVVIDGDVTIAAGVSGALVDGLFVDGSVLVNGANGSVTFRNSRVTENVLATGNNTGVYRFENCDIETAAIVNGTGNAEFIFSGGVSENDFFLNSPGTMIVENRSRVKAVLHEAGNMIVQNIGVIESLASTPDNGFLAVMSSSLFDPLTSTYGTISKTGLCPFVFQDFGRDNTDTTALNGPKFIVSNGRDVHGNYDPAFYALPNGQTLNSHFAGIDAALETLQEYSPLDRLVPVDLGFSFTGGWTDGETIGAHVVSRSTIVPENMAGSVFSTDSSTLDGVLNIVVGPSVVGTVTIVDGIATFASSSFNLDPGQTVRVVTTSDGTFDYAALTLVGHREVVYVN
ncbi:putative tail fiber protein [Agrobacterium phage Milano]|uniref:Tail fiber protein n=1 Tax=Agrobacterium phage Milano TaxID=2557550 RepID=A0ACD6BA99_9CAUD|nr:Chain P1, Tail Spike protein, gp124 [Agrobacterium phage Milano]8FQC_Q1 Chain Q1, Tail Spike protein, gp124 [Agrobacterium phage Milano]8FQC_R1 Chain R1, Tail Spike protein, gp124 [Agrobacterium phage Milano]8FQC_r1 Chain r1, Tail Spike protein, gp124 [Agrobacterium phage Milano]8FQC_s1 Chain s1, Tail Spike protein, gp124 [Agrobacterium phage Milano]8FQC_t1 Chain t1, Tail Spike protein, gp124 [Agrobacterium phage Milano]QBQ72146.1 putative tail fiber protein [Agrobacterium phage Milano]